MESDGSLHQLYNNVVVMGDLNSRMNLCGDGYNPAGRFLEKALMNSNYYERLALDEPTFRNQSVLDHAIASKSLIGSVQQAGQKLRHLPELQIMFQSSSSWNSQKCNQAETQA